jgi:hypothetical protein
VLEKNSGQHLVNELLEVLSVCLGQVRIMFLGERKMIPANIKYEVVNCPDMPLADRVDRLEPKVEALEKAGSARR